MTEAERRTALEAVAAEVRACTRCRLAQGRANAVPGEGHPSTEVLFVGEGPGLNEDRQGRPFVGAAGQFLDELLASVGWSRDEVFITNVVKCRPPQNRDPEPDEIEACASFLRRQMEALDPALVVTLGRHSMGRFMPGARIGQVHGTFQPAPPDMGADDALVFAMYHPAAALHQQSLRQTLLDDMAQAPAALLEARRRAEAARSADGAGETLDAALAPEPEPTPLLEPPAADAPTSASEPAAAPVAAEAPDSTAAPEATPATEPLAQPPPAPAAAPTETGSEAPAAPEPTPIGTPASDGSEPTAPAVGAHDAPWEPDDDAAGNAIVPDTAVPDDQMTLFQS